MLPRNNNAREIRSETASALPLLRFFLSVCWLSAVGLTPATTASAQQSATENPPTTITIQGTRVSIEDADAILRARMPAAATAAAAPLGGQSFSSGLSATATTCSSGTFPAEIITLAAALKCDPDLIFEYVYNNIEYEPLFGSNKGPLGTLLDQRGNDIDQAQLLVALLRAAGFSPSQLNYQYGYIRISGAQAVGWLGVKNDAFAIGMLLQNGGAPFGNLTYNPDGTLFSIDLAHVWVQAQFNGTWYAFDPSFKQHTVSNGLTDLATKLGYSKAQLLADGGGTSDAVSISNINRTAIRNDLVTYSTNLSNYIKQQNPAWTVKDVIGGKDIEYLTGSPLRQTALPTLSPDQPTGFPQSWGTTVPDAYRTCFTISMPGTTASPCTSPNSTTIKLFADETYGRRITVFSVPSGANYVPTLLLDGAPPPNGQSTGTPLPPGQTWSINIKILHAYTQAGANEDKTLTVRSGGSYLISTGWGQVGRGMVEKQRKLLAQALAQPNANPASEQVLGQSLAVISYNWLAQLSAQQRLNDQLAKVTTQYHHGVGITGQATIQGQSNTSGPYVDLPLNPVSMTPQTCWPSNTCSFPVPIAAAFFTLAEMLSSLESAVLEQTQAPTAGMIAASTVKLIDMNSTGKTFFADGTTPAGRTAYQNSIRPSLDPASGGNYLAPDLYAIDVAVDLGQQVVIPLNGQIQVGLWKGAGYTLIRQTSNSIGITQKISGGLSGGFSAIDVPAVNVNDNTVWTVFPPPAAPEVPAIINNQTSSWNRMVSDPVDAIAGANVYKNTDIITGNGSFPYALPFGRTYRSSSNTSDVGLGNGWTHSYSFTATPNSEPYHGLGEGSAIDAVSAIAATFVSQDLLADPKTAKVMTVAGVVTRWLTDQLTNNAVLVSSPDSSEQFVWLPHPDGSASVTYNPPLGSATNLTATGSNYVYTTKDGTRLTFAPASAGALSASLTNWTHPNGTNLNLSYDGSGKLTSIANNLGRSLSVGYAGTLISTVTDETARSVTYGYSAANDLISFTDPLQFSTRFSYDNASRLTQIFYPSNPTRAYVTNEYDALGRVRQQLNANGNASSFYFAGSRSEIVDQGGNRHVTYQTPRGKVLKDIWILDPAVGPVFNDTTQSNGIVNVAVNTYDGQDRLTLATAPELGSVKYTYSPDLKHNVIEVEVIPKPGLPLDPLTTTYTYDPIYNKPTSITDPRGLLTTMSYDAATGNLTTSISDVGDSTHFNARKSFTYNNLGLVLTSTDPLGSVTRFTYDSFGNQTSIVRDAGIGRINQGTSVSYSARGDPISVTDPRGNVTKTTYDSARRPVATVAPNGLTTTTKYDPNGQVIQTEQSIYSTLLRTTRATYTLTGKTATTTDASGNTTTFNYDVLDRVFSVADAAGRVMRYGYDALNRQISISNPAIQASPLLKKSYTPDGLLASLTDANNNVTSFDYDRFDRLITTTYPFGTTEELTYDASNNVLSRKTRKGDTIGFSYDNLNRLTTKTPPSPASAVNYRYDLNNRLTGVSDGSAAIAAAVPSSGTSTAFTTTLAYDTLNRPTSIAWTPTSVSAAPPTGSITFGHSYNKVNQRIGQTVTDNTWFNYPAATPSTVSYVPDALNRYSSVGGVSATYDDNGNLTSDGTFTLGYDAENRLISASGAGNTAVYAYNAQGRRKTKTVNGTTTVFITGADNREVLEYDGASGAILHWYAYGLGSNDVLSQMNVVAATRATFVPDIQGSVISSIDSSSGTMSKIGYLPYGRSAGAVPSFGYTGQRNDAETNGLYFYRARHYSPAWGRFLQTDPIGYAGGSNLYAYVGNDPLNLVDPTGYIATDRPSASSASTVALPAIGAPAAAGGAAVAVGALGAAAVTCVLLCPSQMGSDLPMSLNIALGEETPSQRATLHGNSLDSQRQTYVYQLTSQTTGEVLKYGITSEPNPTSRYPAAFYAATNSSMDVIASYSNRGYARAHEITVSGLYVMQNGRLPPLSRIP